MNDRFFDDEPNAFGPAPLGEAATLGHIVNIDGMNAHNGELADALLLRLLKHAWPGEDPEQCQNN